MRNPRQTKTTAKAFFRFVIHAVVILVMFVAWLLVAIFVVSFVVASLILPFVIASLSLNP